MKKRFIIPLLLLLPLTMGAIPLSQSDFLAAPSMTNAAFDETPEPFILPTSVSPVLPCDPSAVHGLYFYKTDCPHCIAVLDEIIYPYQSKYGSDLHLRLVNIDYADNYELLIRTEEYFSIASEDRAIPTMVIGEMILIGEEEIRTSLHGLIDNGLEAGGVDWSAIPDFDPNAIVEAGSAQAAEQTCSLNSEDSCDVSAPIHAAYFFQTGCQVCSRVEADLAYLRSKYPQLIVTSFNIYDNADLAQWMANRVGREDMGFPAVFIGNQAWIGEEEIDPDNLVEAMECFKTEGSPKFWDAYNEEQGGQGVIDRFRSMSWVTVVLAGLVDGLNPCAFATLIFFVSYLSLSGRKGKEILFVGAAFTVGVFLAYLLIGFGFYRVLDLLGNWLNLLGKVVYGITALLCIVFGILSFSDYIKTRKGDLSDMSLKLPENLRKRINKTIRKGRNIQAYALGAFVTGLIVSLLELACTGQVYLPTIIFVRSMPELQLKSTLFLILYNLLFILPLLVVFVMVYFGTSSKQLTDFMQKRGSVIKLVMAILFLVLGVWLGLSIFK